MLEAAFGGIGNEGVCLNCLPWWSFARAKPNAKLQTADIDKYAPYSLAEDKEAAETNKAMTELQACRRTRLAIYMDVTTASI